MLSLGMLLAWCATPIRGALLETILPPGFGFDRLLQDLENGEPFHAAVEAFCQGFLYGE